MTRLLRFVKFTKFISHCLFEILLRFVKFTKFISHCLFEILFIFVFFFQRLFACWTISILHTFLFRFIYHAILFVVFVLRYTHSLLYAHARSVSAEFSFHLSFCLFHMIRNLLTSLVTHFHLH